MGESTELNLTDTETVETDGLSSGNTANPEVSENPEYVALTVQDYNHFAISFIPVGFLCGALIMIIGFSLNGIMKIFKKV